MKTLEGSPEDAELVRSLNRMYAQLEILPGAIAKAEETLSNRLGDCRAIRFEGETIYVRHGEGAE